MRQKLTRFLRTKTPAVRKSKGVTITEVVIATSLLIIAIVPILKALTIAHVTSSTIERKTNSLILAQAKLDEIKAHSIYDYSSTFAQTNTSLEGLYLCNVTDTSINTNLRQIQVSVGGDLNSNSTLDTDEIEVTLTTLIAKRW